jgi:hypothetical protein
MRNALQPVVLAAEVGQVHCQSPDLTTQRTRKSYPSRMSRTIALGWQLPLLPTAEQLQRHNDTLEQKD